MFLNIYTNIYNLICSCLIHSVCVGVHISVHVHMILKCTVCLWVVIFYYLTLHQFQENSMFWIECFNHIIYIYIYIYIYIICKNLCVESFNLFCMSYVRWRGHPLVIIPTIFWRENFTDNNINQSRRIGFFGWLKMSRRVELRLLFYI